MDKGGKRKGRGTPAPRRAYVNKNLQEFQQRQRNWLRFLRLTWNKIGHFGDVFPSQSLSLVLNHTQQKQACFHRNYTMTYN